VLSLGDICAANDDGGDNAVLTQVNRRQSKKSKKTAALSTVQTRQSVSASEAVTQSEKSSRAIAGSVESAVYGDDPVVAQLQKTVGQLTTTVHVQQATIDSLTRKLNFVLSFLDIQDDVDTQRRDEVTVSQTSSSFHSTASHTEHSTQQTGSTPNRVSYSSAAAAGVSDRRNATSQPVNFREAVAVAMCVDRRDKERRAKSVIVTGLVSQQDVTDAAMFRQLCSEEFGLDPVITHTKRLGVSNGDRVQPLLVGLQSPDEVLSVISHAKLLRRSTVESIRNNVFINRNLTKVEARLAYEERCRRRLRQQVNSQQPSVRQHHDRQQMRPPSNVQQTVTGQPDENSQGRSESYGGAPASASVNALPSTLPAVAAGRHR